MLGLRPILAQALRKISADKNLLYKCRSPYDRSALVVIYLHNRSQCCIIYIGEV